MTTTHTPGPWHLAEIPNHPVFVMAGLQSICEIAHPGDFTAPSPDMEANARLIAAAPDLLAALERLVDAVDRNAVRQEDWPELRQAYEAIRQSRGEG
jgi:hypothetical protein